MVEKIRVAIWVKRVIGWAVALVLLYWMLLSFLIGLARLGRHFYDVASSIYNHVHFSTPLDLIVSPINFSQLISADNIPLLLAYLLLLACGLLISSARAQARRLNETLARIRDDKFAKKVEEEISGEKERWVPVPSDAQSSPSHSGYADLINAIERLTFELASQRQNKTKHNLVWMFLSPVIVGFIVGAYQLFLNRL